MSQLTAAVALASGLMACGSDSNGNGNNGNGGGEGNGGEELVLTEATYLKANNGSENAGTVETITEYDDLQKQFNSGANEGLELDSNGNLIQAADITDSALRFACAITLRGDEADFDVNRDRELSGSNTGLLNPKGIAYADSHGLVLVANFNATQITVFGSAAGGDATPVAVSALSVKPWDLTYVDADDRLFVALTDGTVAVYDDYVANGFVSTPNRIITPVDGDGNILSINSHGIAYDATGDRLVVSDVGDADVATDGAIFVIESAASADGNTSVARHISGPTTMLGNPVDIVLNGSELRVAEKSNDAILVYADIFSGDSGDVEPDLITSSVKPESLVQVPDTFNLIDASETTDAGMVASIIASSNPAEGSATYGQILGFDTSLSAASSTFATGMSIESVSLDNAGDLYATYDSDMGAGVFVAGRGAGVRADGSTDMARDRMITGAATTLVSPKGLDIDSMNGLIFVAENDSVEPGIKIFSACAGGNSSPLMTLGNSGDVSPWDVDYDASTDTAFVALTDGTVAIYENVVSSMNDGTMDVAMQDRTITPTINGEAMQAPTNLHGIDYDPSSDSLVVSDVGDAAIANDGKLYVLPGAAMADGPLDVSVSISGDATMLGNPVDLMFDGTAVYVAEKSNSLILRFDDVFASPGGDISPSASVELPSAESVALKSSQIN
ncbi:hypothetical protein GCM10025791_31990 [Halioxenophilus aromaticivorans]|uniref:NHL repeat containing protein n=1 Tax=Halioxenophilus aromaticivorans TaxID=1306992 RepID=A0AAV3U519_9ALTE